MGWGGAGALPQAPQDPRGGRGGGAVMGKKKKGTTKEKGVGGRDQGQPRAHPAVPTSPCPPWGGEGGQPRVKRNPPPPHLEVGGSPIVAPTPPPPPGQLGWVKATPAPAAWGTDGRLRQDGRTDGRGGGGRGGLRRGGGSWGGGVCVPPASPAQKMSGHRLQSCFSLLSQ